MMLRWPSEFFGPRRRSSTVFRPDRIKSIQHGAMLRTIVDACATDLSFIRDLLRPQRGCGQPLARSGHTQFATKSLDQAVTVTFSIRCGFSGCFVIKIG